MRQFRSAFRLLTNGVMDCNSVSSSNSLPLFYKKEYFLSLFSTNNKAPKIIFFNGKGKTTYVMIQREEKL